MSWTKEDILPARDASGAPLALRGCDLDFLADAVRARGGEVSAAADAAGGPLSAARLQELLLAVSDLQWTAPASGGDYEPARGWVDGDYEPVRADGTALSPAPSFVTDWACSAYGTLHALSADVLRRAFYDVRRMRTAVYLCMGSDESGLVFTPEEQTVGQGELYYHLSINETGGGITSKTRRVTGGALKVICAGVRDGAVTVCLRITSYGSSHDLADSIVPVDGTASGGVVTVPGASLRALADAEVARRGFVEGVIHGDDSSSFFSVLIRSGYYPNATVVAPTGAETDISGIEWGWRPGAEEAT